jgi:hypothetical protein
MSTNNDFVSLAVPSSPGVGTPSDVSDMAFGLSVVVSGPPTSTGEIVIEASEDGVVFAPVTAVFPINNPPAVRLAMVVKFVRVVRFSGSGPAVVAVGAPKTSLNLFGTLSLAPLDTSEMGPFKTIVLVGQYVAPVVIEGSADGTNYDAVASFGTQDSDVISVEGTWATMRVRPNTDLTGVSVALGTGFVAGAGGSGGGAVTRIIAGTNITVSPPSGLGDVTVNGTGGGGSGLIFIAKQTVVGVPSIVTFPGLNGDLDGDYYFEGYLVGLSRPVYLIPNGVLANMRCIISDLIYSGSGTPTEALSDSTAPVISGGSNAGTDFCQFRGYFHGKRQSTGSCRTGRVWSEAQQNNGTRLIRTESAIYWNDQATNITSLVFATDTPEIDVNSVISLWKLPNV